MSKKLEKVSVRLVNKRVPKSENQEDYMISIAENPITLSEGPAGVGKTSLAVYQACQMLASGEIQRIILTRPMVQTGDELGYLPGNVSEKVMPYMLPLLDELFVFLGPEQTNYLISQKIIEIVPLGTIRGRNFHNSFMVCDEAQNASYKQLKAFISRMGKNSKAVICGDPAQADLEDGRGLTSFIDTIRDSRYVGLTEFGYHDIQRSGILKDILGRLEGIPQMSESV